MTQLRSGRPTRDARHASVVAGSLWMVGISLLLFFLPLVNGVIGGVVGGYKVGSVKRGLTAAILPAVAVAIGLWALLSLFDLAVVGSGFAGTLTALIARQLGLRVVLIERRLHPR
ncbi:MAG: NAD(P)-binding protein, partial [Myxococcales bacterium]